MIWLDVKREVAEAIGGIDRLRGRAHHYSVRSVKPPAFIVDLPDEDVVFHAAYQDGMTVMPVPFSVVVGGVDQESAEAELSEYLAESGPRSVKAAVEGRRYTACSDVTVNSARPVVMTFGSVQYLGILFSAEATGRGD